MSPDRPPVPNEPVVDGDVVPEAKPPTAPHPLRGIITFASGVLFLACMDATTKYLVASYDVPAILAIRYAVNLLLMVAVLVPSYGTRLIETRRTGLVFVRALCLAATSILFGSALQYIPVAESTSIIFLAPSLVIVLSRLLLGERMGMIGYISAAAGFTGVLLIARPGTALEPIGVALALTASVVSASYQFLSRVLARTERTIPLLFHSALVGTILFGVAAPWFWNGRAPSAFELLLFLSLGVYATIGHYLFTAAHRYATASTLAPIGYVQVVYSGMLGWLVFGHVPEPLSITGMIVIIASGALIAWGPSRAKRKT